jgi:hypothetical protein
VLLRTATGALGLAALAGGSLAAVVLHGAQPAVVGATLGSVTSLVGAAAALPQPLSLLTDRDRDLSGLSPTRWRLGAGSAASWVGYGWLENQASVWLSAGVGLLCAVVVCAVLQARRTAAVEPPAGRPVSARSTGAWTTFVCPAQARAVLSAA